MASLDSKLFEWQRLRMQCDAASTRLKQAMGSTAPDAAIATLHSEVQQLQDKMATLLAEIDALRRARPASERHEP